MVHSTPLPEPAAFVASIRDTVVLIALDFDGTLAPIVDDPDSVRLGPQQAACLQRLARRTELAIVTGRAVDDVRGRLGFTPAHLVGNHGAEAADGADPAGRADAQRHARVLQPLRDFLARPAVQAQARASGVRVEDKGASIALHHRQAPDPAGAVAAIDGWISAAAAEAAQDPRHGPLTEGPMWRRFGGKQVVNVVAADAPDKADAVLALARRTRAAVVFFAGDDITDEPVFARAPTHWITVRVGPPPPGPLEPVPARHAVDDPAALWRWLDALDRAWPEADPPSGA